MPQTNKEKGTENNGTNGNENVAIKQCGGVVGKFSHAGHHIRFILKRMLMKVTGRGRMQKKDKRNAVLSARQDWRVMAPNMHHRHQSIRHFVCTYETIAIIFHQYDA